MNDKTKDKLAAREARWMERVAELPPAKREQRLAQFRIRAAELDAMSPEQRKQLKEERAAAKNDAS